MLATDKNKHNKPKSQYGSKFKWDNKTPTIGVLYLCIF